MSQFVLCRYNHQIKLSSRLRRVLKVGGLCQHQSQLASIGNINAHPILILLAQSSFTPSIGYWSKVDSLLRMFGMVDIPVLNGLLFNKRRQMGNGPGQTFNFINWYLCLGIWFVSNKTPVWKCTEQNLIVP